MQKKIIQTVVICCLLWGSPSCIVRAQKVSSTDDTIATENIGISKIEDDVFDLINDYREQKGLTILEWVDAIHAEAKHHSSNMATNQVPFSHDGFEERVERLRKKVPKYVTAAAENVAFGKLTASQVVKGWLNSKGHKKNIEGNYSCTGVGIAKDSKGNLLFTQIFLNDK